MNLTQEQQFIVDSAKELTDREIWPMKPQLEKKDYALTKSILDKIGELGFFGIDVPEEYGGLNMGFVSSILAAEYLSGASGAIGTAYGVQSGIGLYPIVMYGTEAQKQKYVTEIVSGEKFSAYALTEPSAGSDANSGKSTATPNPGGYTLNGQKMWISNAGFADYFVVFAKIADDKKLSAFIVHADDEGVTLGEEEPKLGIKSSSTRQVFFKDVKLPADRLLGEREGGFKIAMVTLNLGRIKLAAATLDAMRRGIAVTKEYAQQRTQFKTALIDMEAVSMKLEKAEKNLEVHRKKLYEVCQKIEDMKNKTDIVTALTYYSAECAALKVSCSDTLFYMMDDMMMIHGGMGFSEDIPLESMLRDAWITRTYEGTNDINRQVALVGLMMKDKSFKGKFRMFLHRKALQSLKGGPSKAMHKHLLPLADKIIKEFIYA